MSGTSLDGIDAAIVEIRGRRLEMLASATLPYPREIREALLAMSNCQTHTSEIAHMHFLLPRHYAAAIYMAQSRIEKPIELIGCHGQTIFHQSTPVRYHGSAIASTLQIGDGSVLAGLTGCPVVSDFRPADMAAGGKGAPLVPFVDYLMFRDPLQDRIALNIGGIANLTAIPAGAGPEKVRAFDTGPGNMVIDALVSRHTAGRLGFDRGGKIARTGTVDAGLLRELLADPYYTAKPPKTAGREQYGREFIARLLATGRPLPDLIATAAALTAATVAAGINRFVRFRGGELIVSGGGLHNPVILAHLAALLPKFEVRPSADFGVDPDAKEAVAFAILAHETWRRRPSNLPSATGARHPAILGKISFPPPPSRAR